ncbi:MAG: DUF3857 domain-containing protein [Ferruginibacter sp.]
MKRTVLIFFLLSFLLTAKTQDKLPSFGKIDKADLEIKDCDFDPGAEALVLFDVGEMEIRYVENLGWLSESIYRVRIKILKASGVDRAQVTLHYYPKNRLEEITNVTGISYNLDENGKIVETKLENRSVFDKTIDNESAEVSFALPNVKVGTVFEYKYRHQRKSYSYIPTWYFQAKIPVKYSALNIVIPEYFLFSTQTTLRQKMDDEKKNETGKWYILRNIPGLKDEPYSAGTRDYIQRVEFKLTGINSPTYNEDFRTTWAKVITELQEDEDFGKAIKKNLKGTSELDAKLALIPSTEEKVRTVYKYVQSNMQWNESYGIYSFKGIKDAWDKKNGSITDINFILVKLLQDAGIDAKPLLVSTKDHGSINTFYPFLNQFNCALAYVKKGEKTYVMNAADKYNPFNLIPYDVLYTSALVVDKSEGGIIKLDSDDKAENTIFFTCSVDADGKLSGQATMNSLGYARNVRMHLHNTARLKEAFEDNSGVNIKVDSLAVNNEKDEMLPLEQKVGLSGGIQSSGDYYFLPYNLFTSLGKNPFIAEDRVTDIDFNYPKKYTVTGSWILPENFSVNELPKNTKMIMPDTSIVLSRIVQHDGNIISTRFTLDLRASGYSADSYPYIKEFFRQLYLILDERIVLKKK